MPVMSNIVLDDATSPTPVAHTFKPISLVDNLGRWNDNSTGTLATWPVITCSVRPAQANNGGHKSIWKIELPLVVTPEDGTCCVPKGTPLPRNMVTIETLRSVDSDEASISNLLAFLADLATDTQFVAVAKGESLR